MTTELILPAPKNAAATTIMSRLDAMRSFLPPSMEPNQFFASILTEVNQLPENIDQRSVAMCCINAAVIGLMPGMFLGHCHFIPYWFHRGKPDEKQLCQLVVGYKGFLELAFANDFLTQINPEVVLRGEEFSQWHDHEGPKIKHSIPLERRLQKSDVIASYTTYRTKAGGFGLALVTKMELDIVDTGQNVWLTNYIPMAKKTSIRRAAKEWRLSSRLARAITLDEEAERGDLQSCPELPDENEQRPTDTIGNTRRTFDSTLNHLIGCQSNADRNAVLSWAGSAVTYEGIVGFADLMANINNELRHRNSKEYIPWSDMLKLATSNSSN